ncbi:hypothetical protein ACFY5F_29790 [Streptomyces sp. NPDC013161]|uniref:hypothetical protein n=1 Tax=Streptomyces sp. NPDC013161 TaxID=3364862 RepID=UPI00369ED1AE
MGRTGGAHDASNQSDALDEIPMDTDEAFGSATVVFARSVTDAEATARREAAETAERIHRETPSAREGADLRDSRPVTGKPGRVSHRYR